jgi:hypothetical protein
VVCAWYCKRSLSGFLLNLKEQRRQRHLCRKALLAQPRAQSSTRNAASPAPFRLPRLCRFLSIFAELYGCRSVFRRMCREKGVLVWERAFVLGFTTVTLLNFSVEWICRVCLHNGVLLVVWADVFAVCCLVVLSLLAGK